MLFMLNPDHLGTLTGSSLGMKLIYGAIVMQTTGTLIIRKMVQLEYLTCRNLRLRCSLCLHPWR